VNEIQQAGRHYRQTAKRSLGREAALALDRSSCSCPFYRRTRCAARYLKAAASALLIEFGFFVRPTAVPRR
jgi:hypothetical protein